MNKCRTPLEAGCRRAAVCAMAGFTLLEMMIVIAIILVLASIGAGRYTAAVGHAREAALKEDLSIMRKAIQDYTRDKEAAPTSLDDLVQAQYLREIPKDPTTGGRDWNTSNCDTALSPEQSSFGICDVNSASPGVSPFDGTPYSTW
ncbi:MAG TPA: type II secretion system protein [Candidatus Sulfotelmatobacter sp.]|nr:type II secretion system protein [Candidatus Sulfotelmatobacter sp.]